MESLESRRLLSAAPPLPVPLVVNEAAMPDGTTQLQVIGTLRKNAITLTQTADGITIGNTGGWSQSVGGTFSSILIHAGAGHDSVSVDASVTIDCVIYGGRGDTLQGGSGNDSIYAGAGASVVFAGSGLDTIVTLAGRGSIVHGGNGLDNFWVGRTDQILGLTQEEIAVGAVHRIASFLPYHFGRRVFNVPMALNGQTLPEPFAPDAAGYAPTQGYPLFGPDGPLPTDVQQGLSGDCYFLATLSSIADTDPMAMPQSIASLGDGTYVVEFFRNGRPVYVREDGYLPVDSNNYVVYGDLGEANSVWVALMEKAYAYFRAGDSNYASLDGGLPAEVYNALDFAYTDSLPATESQFIAALLSDEQAGRAAVFCTTDAPATSQLVPDHAYMVNFVLTDASGFPLALELRNPWGTDSQGNPTSEGYIDLNLQVAFASLSDYCSAVV